MAKLNEKFYYQKMDQVRVRRRTLEKFRLHREEESVRNYNFRPSINPVSAYLAQNRSHLEERVEDYLIRKGQEKKSRLKTQFIQRRFQEDRQFAFRPQINRRSCHLNKKRQDKKITFGITEEEREDWETSGESTDTRYFEGKKISRAMNQILMEERQKMPFCPKINPLTDQLVMNSKMGSLDFLARQSRFLKEKKRRICELTQERDLQESKVGFFKKKRRLREQSKGLYERGVEKIIREEQVREKVGRKEKEEREKKKTTGHSERLISQKKEEMVEGLYHLLSNGGEHDWIGADNAHIDNLDDRILSK